MTGDATAPVNSVTADFGEAYNVIKVPHNGDCMFASLAIGLNRSGTPRAAQQIRTEIVAYMRLHPEVVSVNVLYF